MSLSRAPQIRKKVSALSRRFTYTFLIMDCIQRASAPRRFPLFTGLFNETKKMDINEMSFVVGNRHENKEKYPLATQILAAGTQCRNNVKAVRYITASAHSACNALFLQANRSSRCVETLLTSIMSVNYPATVHY